MLCNAVVPARTTATSYTPVTTDRSNAASAPKRLARLLLAARNASTRDDAIDALPVAAAAFARCCRRTGHTPERMVIALKAVFRRLDGTTPSLATHDTEENLTFGATTCGHWYPAVFAWCLDAYFARD
jgi:hypothetical protein